MLFFFVKIANLNALLCSSVHTHIHNSDVIHNYAPPFLVFICFLHRNCRNSLIVLKFVYIIFSCYCKQFVTHAEQDYCKSCCLWPFYRTCLGSTQQLFLDAVDALALYRSRQCAVTNKSRRATSR